MCEHQQEYFALSTVFILQMVCLYYTWCVHICTVFVLHTVCLYYILCVYITLCIYIIHDVFILQNSLPQNQCLASMMEPYRWPSLTSDRLVSLTLEFPFL